MLTGPNKHEVLACIVAHGRERAKERREERRGGMIGNSGRRNRGGKQASKHRVLYI